VGKGIRVEFVFSCGWCGEDNYLWGAPVASWWRDKYEVDSEWDCWACGETCVTHAPPWTEA
jgi:hypothetical protein